MLKEEFENEQMTNANEVTNFLKEKLSGFFDAIKDEKEISIFILQHCIYPRMMMSPSDALYSIKFIKILVELQVPKLNILNIFAQVLKGIIPTIHCCTNNEAENLGIFLMEYF